MLGLGKEQPAAGEDARDMADHRQSRQRVFQRKAGHRQQQQQERQHKGERDPNHPQFLRVFAAHHMHKFPQQVIAAGVRWLKRADRAARA